MSDSRYHPANDPVLQAFKQYWAVPFEKVIQSYLEGTVTSAEIITRFYSKTRESNVEALQHWKTELEKKSNERKTDLSSKEIFLLAMYCFYSSNFSEALNYFMSIQKEDGAAELMLGRMYREGLGVEQSHKKAIEYYQAAILLGNAEALCNLGFMYEKGLGVNADLEQAIQNYQKSALMNCAEAFHNLGFAYVYGDGLKQDLSQGTQYLEKAAKAGVVASLLILGRLYEDKGQPADYARTATYLRYATEKHDGYRSELQYLYNRHSDIPEVSYHATILLELPDKLNSIAIEHPEIFDELLRDDDWGKIKPLLVPEIAEKVLERNKEYLAKHQILIEDKASLPPWVSKLILSYTVADENLLKGVGEQTQEIRATESKRREENSAKKIENEDHTPKTNFGKKP